MMSAMTENGADQNWRDIAAAQQGLITRRQLRACGLSANRARNNIAAERWAVRSSTVISTFTGSLSQVQRCWLGVLHAGGTSVVGGLTAAGLHGLRGWDRDEITILVRHRLVLDPVPGIRFIRTRRALAKMRATSAGIPLCVVEPAVILAAAYGLSRRAGQGLLAAAVQQKISTAGRLIEWLERLRPVHRAPLFREALAAIDGGAQSMGEIDIGRICRDFGLPQPERQTRRKDSAGAYRYTDCEWRTRDGRVIVLEIDGAFHMEFDHWQSDIARQRRLSDPDRQVVRCTTLELRDDPRSVVVDLVRMGVPSSVIRLGSPAWR